MDREQHYKKKRTASNLTPRSSTSKSFKRFGEAEDKLGKESRSYLEKKLLQLRVASEKEEKEQLVSESEEIIRQAHKGSFHKI